MPAADPILRCVLAFALPVLAACAGPAQPPPSRPVAAAAPVGGPPGGAYARELEEQRRGIGVPPALPPPGAIDRVPDILRSSRPAPGVGPATNPPAPSLPVPGNSQSRLSALPASPLANPRGGFAPGRP
ncbi:hypothetical protein GCM10009416_39670 [Craurococcus roseus]|uniref:Uncharacterized protein n=1 Tax=Craurococcus roseus TaxID=77585 RepID=A0ABP3QZS7_9PROT